MIEEFTVQGQSLKATIYYAPAERPLGDYPGCGEEFIVEKLETEDGFDIADFLGAELGLDVVALSEWARQRLTKQIAREAA
jgi:hypothetical protein